MRAKIWLMKTAFIIGKPKREWAKPFQFQCEQNDITADHENWTEQQSKQDS